MLILPPKSRWHNTNSLLVGNGGTGNSCFQRLLFPVFLGKWNYKLFSEIKSLPKYTTEHLGTAIVLGAGPEVWEEFNIALSLLTEKRPYIIAVNLMYKFFDCDAVVSCNAENYGAIKPVLHHYPNGRKDKCSHMDFVDHIWDGLNNAGGGSSSLCAALIAKSIGFSNVILCGVPLTPTGYYKDYPRSDCVVRKNNSAILNLRHEIWSSFHKKGWLSNVSSFSGFTKSLLGPPDFKGLN